MIMTKTITRNDNEKDKDNDIDNGQQQSQQLSKENESNTNPPNCLMFVLSCLMVVLWLFYGCLDLSCLVLS